MDRETDTYRLFFGTLANPNRLKIVNALREISRDVTQICHHTRLEQSMVSHHLKRLEKCGMVSVVQQGKHHYYSLNKETIQPLMRMIDEHMCRHCRHVLEQDVNK